MPSKQQDLPEASAPDSKEVELDKQSASQQKAISRQVEWFMQDFLPWGLGGMGGITGLHFLMQSKVLEAIVTFVVTLGVASWMKYSKNFIKTFSTIAGKRGDEDARSLAQGIGHVGSVTAEALKWKFSRFINQYLDYQAHDCRDLETEGFGLADARIPMLQEVFVPLRLASPRDKEEVNLRSIQESVNDDSLDIWTLLRRSEKEPRYRQIAIQAKGGYGKTTLLQHVTLIYGLRQNQKKKFRAAKRVPFLLRLRDYREELSRPNIKSLSELIHEYNLQGLRKKGINPPTDNWAEILLNRGDALVMLDGFDEVNGNLQEKVSYWITAQMEAYPESTFILTSRPIAYEKFYLARRPSLPIIVQRFTEDQQQAFVQQWYQCHERAYRSDESTKTADQKAETRTEEFLIQLRSRPELEEMAQVPLLLNLLVTYHRNNVVRTLPSQRLELYRGICKLQLEDRPRARGIDMLVPYDRTMVILRTLAWTMMKESASGISEDGKESSMLTISKSDLLTFLGQQKILQDEEVTADEFLRKIVEVGELLVEKEAGEYEFPHASFQGFFGAEAVTRMEDSQEIVLGKWLQAKDNPVWQEVIPFVTAQLLLKQFSPILREALKLGPEAVELAAKCLKEYRHAERLGPELEREITLLRGLVNQSRYANLEKFLEDREWKLANKETNRVMLEVQEKYASETLNSNDLRKFPCDDLLIIDRLWLKASGGHFGFSVQIKIWKESGSPKKYNADYEMFMEKMGWWKDGKFVYYPSLQFSQTDSLEGELPWLDGGKSGVGLGGVPYLAERIAFCNNQT
jgi:predicted NACHT family NTPase